MLSAGPEVVVNYATNQRSRITFRIWRPWGEWSKRCFCGNSRWSIYDASIHCCQMSAQIRGTYRRDRKPFDAISFLPASSLRMINLQLFSWLPYPTSSLFGFLKFWSLDFYDEVLIPKGYRYWSGSNPKIYVFTQLNDYPRRTHFASGNNVLLQTSKNLHPEKKSMAFSSHFKYQFRATNVAELTLLVIVTTNYSYRKCEHTSFWR